MSRLRVRERMSKKRHQWEPTKVPFEAKCLDCPAKRRQVNGRDFLWLDDKWRKKSPPCEFLIKVVVQDLPLEKRHGLKPGQLLNAESAEPSCRCKGRCFCHNRYAVWVTAPGSLERVKLLRDEWEYENDG